MLDHNLDDEKSWEEKTAYYKDQVLHEFDELGNNLGKVAKTGLIIVGAGAIGYALTKRLLSKKTKNEAAKKAVELVDVNQMPDKPLQTSVKNILKSAAATFVLSLVKDKVISYLNETHDEPAAEDSGEKA